MRRIRLSTGPRALFLAMFVVAMVAFLPLRLALGWVGLGDQGMTARSVGGSVWAGSLTEARFGALALGDLEAGVSPLNLLIGRARVDFDGRDNPPAPGLTGAITMTRHSVGMDDVTASLPVGNAFAPVPVTILDLDQVSVRFEGDSCERAEGRVRATLGGDVAGAAIPVSMSGGVRCDGGALLIPLTSASGGEGAAIRIWPDSRYRAELTLAASDPLAVQRLQLAGFVQNPSGMQLSIEGRF